MRRADFVGFDLIRNRFLLYCALPCFRTFDYLVQLRSRDVCLLLGVACLTIPVTYVLGVDDPITCVSPMPRLREP